MSATSKPIIINHVTDCGDFGCTPGGLAAAKVENAYHINAVNRGLNLQFARVVSALPFNALDAGAKGADLYQTSFKPHNRDGKVQYGLGINAAPPKSDKHGTTNASRENMVVGSLHDGTVIAGTIKGYSLSYLKDEIKELFEVVNTKQVLEILYGDLFHEGMAQFRSHYLQNRLLLDGIYHQVASALMKEDGYDLRPLDKAIIPDPHPESHALTIDEFGNAKLWLSEEDQALLDTIVDKVNKTGTSVKGKFVFSDRSIQAGPATFWRGRSVPIVVSKEMFANKVGTNVWSSTSSSRHGDHVLPQICTLQSLAQKGVKFRLPEPGAVLRLKF